MNLVLYKKYNVYFTVTHSFYTSKLRDVALPTLFLLLLLLRASFPASLKYKTIKGRPAGQKPVATFLSKSFEVCKSDGLARFADGKHYAASFNSKGFYCFIYASEGVLFADSYTVINPEEDWVTYAPTIQPIVLWVLSNVSQGKNSGSAGYLLKLNTRQCEFSTEGGPKGASNVSYCTISRKSYWQVGLFVNNTLRFNFLAAFTIGLWVKTTTEDDCLLVGSIPAVAPYFALWPWSKQLVLFMGLSSSGDVRKGMAQSTQNDKDVNNWRHLAVVYKPPLGVTFYLNGKKWPLLVEMKDISKATRPYLLLLWQKHDGGMAFKGQMACISIFQAPLPDSEMRRLKDFCS